MQCPKCGMDNYDWVQICGRCGNQFPYEVVRKHLLNTFTLQLEKKLNTEKEKVVVRKHFLDTLTLLLKKKSIAELDKIVRASSKASVSAVVTGFPRELRQPKPLPGETPEQLVIRNHSDEWRNFVDTMHYQFNITKAVCDKLLRGDLSDVVDSTLKNEIHTFVNFRIPNHGRTLRGLSEVRRLARETLEEMSSFELTEIIWPKEKDATGNLSDHELAEQVGAKVIPTIASNDKKLDLTFLVQQIKGDFLWLIPGGTRIWIPEVIMQLTRIFDFLTSSPRYALYFDGTYSTIYRVSALKHLISHGKKLSADLRENGSMIHNAGYEITTDDSSSASLCHLEEFYGGRKISYEELDEFFGSKKSKTLMARLFGK